jgi:hypothetical protein
MTEYITQLKDWIVGLGEKHDVDPLLLGCLYLISKLFFFGFLGWVLKSFRAKKSILIPLLFACLSFSIPYTYLIIAGRNISVWVYVFIALMFVYGGFTIWKKITQKHILLMLCIAQVYTD